MEDDEIETEDAGEQGPIRVNRRLEALKPYQYKKGQSGNPSGRPKGSVSMKEYVKNKLATMAPKEREEFLHGLSKDIIWEMAEGKATNEIKGDINLKVEKLDAIQDATKKLLE